MASSLATLYVGLGLVSLAPLVDGDALFGSLLGGWLVTTTQQHLKAWQRLASLLLSAGVGYLFTPVVQPLMPVLSNGAAAFFCAMLVIPISVKLMVWTRAADLREILQRLRGGRP
jgi:hypothetical protein